jgi:hypothetical protein
MGPGLKTFKKKARFFGNLLEMNKSSKKLGVITQFGSEEVVVQIQVTQRYLHVSRAVVY